MDQRLGIEYNLTTLVSDVEGDVVLPRKRPVVTHKESGAEPQRMEKPLLTMLVVSIVFVALSLAYNFLTPAVTPAPLHVFDGGSPNPDETAHVLYVKSVAAGHIPVFSSTSADYEAHQPPLYYSVAAAFEHISSNIHCIRLAATLFGLALIWASFFAVRGIFPNNTDAALGTAIVIALLPMNIALSSSVSNDSASNLVFALFLLMALLILSKPEKSMQYSAIMAVVLAAGMWTKSSTLLLFPLTVIFYGAAALTKAVNFKRAAVCLLLSAAGGLLLSLPWLLRNQHLYGDLFAQSVVFHDLASRNHTPSFFINSLGENWYLNAFFGWTFASYWGVFDSMNLFLPLPAYIALATISLSGLSLGLFNIVRLKKSPLTLTLLVTWAVLTMLTLIGYVQYNEHFFQVQGRYLYPALVPLTAVSVYGFAGISPLLFKKWGSLVLVIGLLLLNLLCLSMISGRYSV